MLDQLGAGPRARILSRTKPTTRRLAHIHAAAGGRCRSCRGRRSARPEGAAAGGGSWRKTPHKRAKNSSPRRCWAGWGGRSGRSDMPRTDAGGGRTVDVPCACGCASVTRIRPEPDAPGRERAVMRAEYVRLHDVVDRITEASAEYRMPMGMARTEGAGRFAAIAARVLEPFMEHLEKLIAAKGWARFDETAMRMSGRQAAHGRPRPRAPPWPSRARPAARRYSTKSSRPPAAWPASPAAAGRTRSSSAGSSGAGGTPSATSGRRPPRPTTPLRGPVRNERVNEWVWLGS